MPIKPVEMFWDSSMTIVHFHFNIFTKNAVDLVAFGLHVANKYGGKITERSRFTSGERRIRGDRGALVVDFGSVTTAGEAYRMRTQALTDGGNLKSSFKGALNASDPRRVQSNLVLEEIRARSSSN